MQRELLWLQRHRGVLYRPHGRERLFAVPALQPGTARNVNKMVEWLTSLAVTDSRAVAEILEGEECRAVALGAKLGIPTTDRCGICDRCMPARAYITDDRADVELALIALGSVPFSVRRGAVHRIVARALKDAGRQCKRSRAAELVDVLIERGFIEPSRGGLGEVLGLSLVGKNTFAALEG